MSILLAAATEISPWEFWIGLTASIIALAMAIGLGWLRPSRLALIRRILPDRPVAPLVGVLFAALLVWQVLPTLYLQSKAVPASPTTATTTSAPLVIRASTRDLVGLSAVVPAIAFCVLLVGDRLVRPHVQQRLGFNFGRLPRGVGAGLLGILFTVPLVYFSMVLAELVFRWVGYEHPPVHELLRAMRETPDEMVKYIAVVAAVAVAPLWEELLFRGHIQTLIREGFTRLREHAMPLDSAARAEVDGPRLLETWLGILLTSAIFAAVHQPWSMPSIFVLSVCLGLAYERSGNLWAPIAMHSAFNALMTTYFLYSSTAN